MSQPQLPQSADEIWPWIVGQFPPEVQPYVNFAAAILVSLLVVFGLIKPFWDALAKRGAQPVPTTGNPHLDALLQLEARGKLDAEERRRLKNALFVHVSAAAAPGDDKAEAREAFDRAVDTVLDQEKPKEAAAQLAEFAKDPIGTIDALLAQAKSAEDFRAAGALAFPIDTARALRAYQQARALDASDLDSLAQLASLHFRLGDNDLAQDAWVELVRIGERGSVDALCMGLNGLGHLANRTGDHVAAEGYYQRSLDAARAMDAPEREAAALGNLGIVAQVRGDFITAERYQQSALTLFRQRGNKEREAIALGNLGVAADARGDLEGAEQYQQSALALERQLGNKDGAARALGNLGINAHRRGDTVLGERYQQESLSLYRELGNKEGAARALCNLGIFAQTRNDLDAAERYQEESLELERQIGRKRGEADSLANLGSIQYERGNLNSARDYWRAALTLYDAIDIAQCDNAITVRTNLTIIGDA